MLPKSSDMKLTLLMTTNAAVQASVLQVRRNRTSFLMLVSIKDWSVLNSSTMRKTINASLIVTQLTLGPPLETMLLNLEWLITPMEKLIRTIAACTATGETLISLLANLLRLVPPLFLTSTTILECAKKSQPLQLFTFYLMKAVKEGYQAKQLRERN